MLQSRWSASGSESFDRCSSQQDQISPVLICSILPLCDIIMVLSLIISWQDDFIHARLFASPEHLLAVSDAICMIWRQGCVLSTLFFLEKDKKADGNIRGLNQSRWVSHQNDEPVDYGSWTYVYFMTRSDTGVWHWSFTETCFCTSGKSFKL